MKKKIFSSILFISMLNNCAKKFSLLFFLHILKEILNVSLVISCLRPYFQCKEFLLPLFLKNYMLTINILKTKYLLTIKNRFNRIHNNYEVVVAPPLVEQNWSLFVVYIASLWWLIFRSCPLTFHSQVVPIIFSLFGF